MGSPSPAFVSCGLEQLGTSRAVSATRGRAHRDAAQLWALSPRREAPSGYKFRQERAPKRSLFPILRVILSGQRLPASSFVNARQSRRSSIWKSYRRWRYCRGAPAPNRQLIAKLMARQLLFKAATSYFPVVRCTAGWSRRIDARPLNSSAHPVFFGNALLPEVATPNSQRRLERYRTTSTGEIASWLTLAIVRMSAEIAGGIQSRRLHAEPSEMLL